MGSRDNLIPAGHKFTPEERAKGGENRARNIKKKKLLREAMQALLDAYVPNKEGKQITGTEALALKAFQAALKGDWKAWELVRDTSGQKPVDKVMMAEVEPEVINEVERIVKETLEAEEQE